MHDEVERYLTERGITAKSFTIKREDGCEVTFRGEAEETEGSRICGERPSTIRGNWLSFH